MLPLRNGRFTFLKLLILIFHFTVVIQIFYPKPKNSFSQLTGGIQVFHTKKASDLDQEIPQLQTTDQPTAP